jgi:hypothetical protein
MLDCGRDGNFWGAYALGCLPDEVLTECEDRLAFVSTTESDGRRLTRQFCEGRDVIVLSERVVSKGFKSEADWHVRYFVFAVLHEIAHAYRDHRPPKEISPEENDAQEAEANGLDFQWLNDFTRQKGSPALPN